MQTAALINVPLLSINIGARKLQQALSREILEWEDVLDSIGPFASLDILIAHRHIAPSMDCPSLPMLEDLISVKTFK